MSGRTPGAMVAVLAGMVAALGIVVGLVWGGVVVWQLTGGFESMDRTGIPGELAVEVDEAGDQVVYYERRSLVAAPVDPDVEISVTGPGGAPVSTESTARVQYRMFHTVRQAHATFAAPEPGNYTVTVDGQTDDDDAAVVVGTGPGTATLGRLAGPIVVLAVGVLALPAFVLALRRHRRAAQPSPPR